MIKPKPIKTYAGMLTQDEFVQYYAYLSARLKAGYSPEEVSFMIGRAPYYFVDYERMERGARLNQYDRKILDEIFKNKLYEQLLLAKDEFHGYQEKRFIRVNLDECGNERQYCIHHPWLIKEKTKKSNKAIQLVETIRVIAPKDNCKIRSEIAYVLQRLKNRAFFQIPQLPYAIHFEVTKLVSRNIYPFPSELKAVLYQLLHEGKLLLKTIEGRMHYFG
ncbi:hypothetical protein GCM10023231_35270 [Olivibacter ginsenosidimutans]|uniref:Uncharacterized protein n=1 Tax=Olivibacter ginsenosidimutans TaxID=1176537 RepID=A0ABP9C0M6_9SPHI